MDNDYQFLNKASFFLRNTDANESSRDGINLAVRR